MKSRTKIKDEFDITIVNYARDQATHADLVLAEEEYARKKAIAMERRGAAPAAAHGTSAVAERVDRAENVRAMQRRLADPDVSLSERNLLQHKLAEEKMAERFKSR